MNVPDHYATFPKLKFIHLEPNLVQAEDSILLRRHFVQHFTTKLNACAEDHFKWKILILNVFQTFKFTPSMPVMILPHFDI